MQHVAGRGVHFEAPHARAPQNASSRRDATTLVLIGVFTIAAALGWCAVLYLSVAANVPALP